MRYVVKVTIGGIGPILCARPYPRSDDHLEAFSYPEKREAENFAAKLQSQFPENSYSVFEA